jgi:hypothetical protein
VGGSSKELSLPRPNPVSKSVSSPRFVPHFIMSSVSSAAGLISFILTGPVMYRIAAIDPALEAFYLALVIGWFWSLTRMWRLTFEARNRG